MTLPYTEMQELYEKYGGTIIYRGDTPVLVETVEIGPTLKIISIGKNQKHEIISPRDPALRDQPFKLGYLNKAQQREGKEDFFGAVYVSRIPKRQWRQGLCENTLHIHSKGISFETLCEMDTFREMLMGKYPTMKRAKALMKGNLRSVAFHPKLAIKGTEFDQIELHYRGFAVGIADEDKKFKLKKDSWFLREFLEANEVEIW